MRRVPIDYASNSFSIARGVSFASYVSATLVNSHNTPIK